MTNQELIDLVLAGKRITCEHSLHTEHKSIPGCIHSYRTIVCDDENDVVECRYCGYQTVVKCNFDEEYS